MLEIRFKCSAVIVVPSGPKSQTFTVILPVFAPSQDGVINREKVYNPPVTRQSAIIFIKEPKACML